MKVNSNVKLVKELEFAVKSAEKLLHNGQKSVFHYIDDFSL